MAIVGKAEVVVRALTDRFRRDLNSSFQDAERDADSAGTASGSRFGSSFSRAAAKNVKDAATGADDAGNVAGTKFRGAFNAGSSDGAQLDIFDLVDDDAERSGGTSGVRFRRAFSDATSDDGQFSLFDVVPNVAGNAGDRAGRSFSDHWRTGLADVADDVDDVTDDAAGRASQNFSKVKFELPDIGGRLAVKIVALVPIIGVLGGALAAVVGGLTAMAAAATFAAGSVAVLATGVVGAVAAVLTAVLALGGVGKAVQALGQKQASAGKSALSGARQQEAAARAIEAAQERIVQAGRRLRDATEALAEARRDAARDAVRDTRAVVDAEHRLQEAQESAQRAQESLTRAREDAVEKLEDLQLQLRGAVIGEEEAQLRLLEAQQRYQETLANSSSTFVEQERARLDLENAELALDQARDRREDVTTETEAANKAGVEGSDEVVAAKERIGDANDDLAQAERNVTDARQQARDDAVESARDIVRSQESVADAEQNVADAIRDLGRAQRDAAADTEAASTANAKLLEDFEKLTPAAQRFAKFLFGLKPVLSDLRAAAGERLFGPLQSAIQNVVDNFLPTLRRALVQTGGGLGEFATRLASMFNTQTFKANFSSVSEGLTTLNVGLEDSNGRAKAGISTFGLFGQVVSNIISSITGVARAALPTFVRFLNYVDNVTRAFASKFEGEENISRMTELIGRMGDAAATIGAIFGQTFGLIGDIFRAALPTGLALNQSLLDTITHLREFTKSAAGQERIRTFFENIVPVFKQVAHFVAALGREFLKLGEDKGGGIERTFQVLTDSLPALREGIETFTNEVAPAMVEVLHNVANILRTVSESSFFPVFIASLNLAGRAVKFLVSTFDQPGVGEFVSSLAGVGAAVLVVSRTLNRLGLGFVNEAFKKLAKRLLGPVANALKDHLNKLKGLAGQYLRAGAEAAKSFARQAAGAVAARVKLIALKVAQLAVAAATKAWAAVQWLLNAAMSANPIGLLIAALVVLVAGLVIAYKRSETFRNIVNSVGRVLKTAASVIVNVVGKAFRFLKNNLQLVLIAFGPLGVAVATIITVFRNFDKIKEFVGKALGAVVEFFRDLPGKIWTALLDAVKKLASFYVQAYAWLFTKVKALLDKVLGFFVELPGKLWSALVNVVVKFTNFVNAARYWLHDKILAVVDSVVSFFKNLPGRVGRFLVEVVMKFVSFVQAVRYWLHDKIWAVIDAVVGFFRKLPGRIVAFAASLGSKLADLVGVVKTYFSDKVRDMVGGVVDFFKDLPGRIAKLVGSVGKAAAGVGKALIDGLLGVFGSAGRFVVDFAKSIYNGLAGLINKFIIDGLNDALEFDLKVKGIGFHVNPPDIPRIPTLARGATVLPRPGGTLALLSEAGRSESVVDTGLLNQRLRDDLGRREDVVAELRRIRAAIERISGLNGLTIENFTATAAPGEVAASSVPRALRGLAFELGA